MCSADTPCFRFNNHDPVRGHTEEATPFPHGLCSFLVQCIEHDVGHRRHEAESYALSEARALHEQPCADKHSLLKTCEWIKEQLSAD